MEWINYMAENPIIYCDWHLCQLIQNMQLPVEIPAVPCQAFIDILFDLYQADMSFM